MSLLNMFSIKVDQQTVREVTPVDIQLENGVEELILSELHTELNEIFNILLPVCPDKIGTNELRRVIALKGFKITT